MKSKTMRASLVAALLLCAVTLASAREMRALLVGVSEYPNLNGHDLEGPRNDVQRMRELLIERRGFAPAKITVLADGVPGASLPTRAAVLGALDELGRTANKDDFVLIYLAGHGSQAPAYPKEKPKAGGLTAKPDGLAQVFLPRDVGSWSLTEAGDLARIPNSIQDFEIRDRVDRITARGAFVWGIFDTCHSATMVRGADDDPEVRFRNVRPEDLGVPRRLLDAAADAQALKKPAPADAIEQSSTEMAAADRNAGGSVFFYAAQTTQQTPEIRLPLGDPNRRSYGLFSYTLVQALESGVSMSYRQLGQYILSQYGGINIGRRPTTPLFSGTRLDTLVMGQQTLPVQQWRLDLSSPAASLPAGALSQLSEGSVFALLSDPLADSKTALGYAVANTVGMTSTTLTTVTRDGRPALAARDIPAGSYARLIHTAPQLALKVTVDLGDCGANCATAAAIAAVQAKPLEGATLRWLAAPAIGDVAIRAYADHLLLVPPALQGMHCKARKTASERARCEQDLSAGSMLLKPGNEEALRDALHRVSRATNLMRIATLRQPGAVATSPLQLRLTHLRPGARPAPFTADHVPDLRPGDQVEVSFSNTGDKPLDVTLLYLDANYGVSALFPESGASNRLERKGSQSLTLNINDETTGLERLLAIAVEMTELGERADFSFLAQTPLLNARSRDVRSAGRGEEESDDMLAFRDAGFSDFRSRGADVAPKAPSTRTSMQVFSLNIQP